MLFDSLNISPKLKLVLNIALSLLTFGVGWAINNQATLVTGVAIVLAWLVNFLIKRAGVQIHRGWITVVVYVASFGLALFFAPVVFPAFPLLALPLPADTALAAVAIAAYMGVVVTYVGQLVTLLTPYAGAAMAIYNVMLKSVFDQLEGGVTTLLAPRKSSAKRK